MSSEPLRAVDWVGDLGHRPSCFRGTYSLVRLPPSGPMFLWVSLLELGSPPPPVWILFAWPLGLWPASYVSSAELGPFWVNQCPKGWHRDALGRGEFQHCCVSSVRGNGIGKGMGEKGSSPKPRLGPHLPHPVPALWDHPSQTPDGNPIDLLVYSVPTMCRCCAKHWREGYPGDLHVDGAFEEFSF